MKKLLLIALLIVGTAFSREYIAVIDFEGINISKGDAKALTQRLTSEIIKLGVYQVLERSEMKELLEEQKFQYSGCVDLKCAVELGKILGAKYMVVGSISKLGKTYSIDSRLIDVKTSESFISGSYSMKGEIDGLMDTGMQSIAYQLCDLEVDSSYKYNINQKNDRTLGIDIGIGNWIYKGNPIGDPYYFSIHWELDKLGYILNLQPKNPLQRIVNSLEIEMSVNQKNNNRQHFGFYINKYYLHSNNNYFIGIGYTPNKISQWTEQRIFKLQGGFNYLLLSISSLDICLGGKLGVGSNFGFKPTYMFSTYLSSSF